MAGGPLTDVLSYLRKIANLGPAAAAADQVLLERFARDRDAAAFEEILARHGPMVLGVCQGILRDTHEAEDAFQATFLVLVRRAGAVGQPERLANWLYGVAYRVATRARVNSARRRSQVREDTDLVAAAPGPEEVSKDEGAVLQEEVNRLPDRFRIPIVLCYFEGKTLDEASQELGWSRGSVKGRLERGRERLRTRLARRGLGPAAGTFVNVFAQNAAPASVPGPLLKATAAAAVLTAAGKPATGIVSPNVFALTEGVIKAMFVAKLKTLAVVVLAVGFLSTGAGVVAFRTLAGEGPPKTAEKAPTPAPAPAAAPNPASSVEALAKARLKLAREVFDGLKKGYLAGAVGQDDFWLWSGELLKAELDAAANKNDRLRALEAHLDRMKEYEKLAKMRHEAGNITNTEFAKVQLLRVEAELALAKEKAK